MITYIRSLLPEYEFQQGTEENLEEQYQIKRSNTAFFERTGQHPVTMEDCRVDLTACPPTVSAENQFFWQVYEHGKCIALLAYLQHYPESDTAYLGLLMVDAVLHGKGIGRKVNAAFMRAAAKAGYKKIRLGCYLTNEPGYWFWRKNRYVAIKTVERETEGKVYPLLIMESDISDTHMFEPEETRKTIYRCERGTDYHQSEEMTRQAFWNKHGRGCSEHYLLHQLRKDSAFVPKLSMVAEVAEKIVGGIWYSVAKVIKQEKAFEVLTFGPLSVPPEYQGTGVGGNLLEKSMKLAKEAGYPGIIIFGEPDYYPKHGFKTCDNYGITTPEGKNFPAFMGIELQKGAFAKMCGGRFFEAEIFDNLPQEKVDEFDKGFIPMEKLKVPGQWP